MNALFSTFGIDWHLLFANSLNFIILAALLTWLLYKPVMRIVAEREQVIAKGVQDAESAAQALMAADAEAGKRMTAAETQASTILEDARTTANDERARIMKEAETRAAHVASDAEARAQEAASKAIRESEKEIARLAVLAAAKVVAEKP